MPKVQPKKTGPKVRKLYSKPALILLVLIIFLLGKATWGVYQKELESRKNVAMVKTELDNLEKRREVLKEETQKLNTQEGVEDAIRQKFQVSKDGERVLVVVDKSLPTATAEVKESFFTKMWGSMSGIFKKQ